MKKLFIFSAFMLFISINISAQQEAQFTQNMFNHTAINPGFYGDNGSICATALVRNQWMGFPGAPKTNLISVDGAVNPLHGGLGLTIMQDQLGFETNISVEFGYAYRMPLGPGNLGLGLSLGFLNKTIDFTEFDPIDKSDMIIMNKAEEKDMLTDFTFGAFYKIENQLYFGLALSQISKAGAEFGSGNYANYTLARHLYITGGYQYQVEGTPFEINPSLFVKTDGASAQIDINGLVRYNNIYWGGLSWRNQDAIAIIIGGMPFNSGFFKPLKVGFAYDITTSALSKNGSSGSVEIMLGYCFKIEIERAPQSYKNVRFL